MLLFHTDNTGTDKNVHPFIYHLITENGKEAQFVDQSGATANGIAGQLGNSVKTDLAFIASIKDQLAK